MEHPKDIAARIRPFLAAMERSIDSARGRRTNELRPSKPQTFTPVQPAPPQPPPSGLTGTSPSAAAGSTKLKARRKDSLTPFGSGFSGMPTAQRKAV